MELTKEELEFLKTEKEKAYGDAETLINNLVRKNVKLINKIRDLTEEVQETLKVTEERV